MEKIYVILTETQFSPEMKCAGIGQDGFRDVANAVAYLQSKDDQPQMMGEDPRFWQTNPKLKNIPQSRYTIMEVEIQD